MPHILHAYGVIQDIGRPPFDEKGSESTEARVYQSNKVCEVLGERVDVFRQLDAYVVYGVSKLA